jgi:hypothetical protein
MVQVLPAVPSFSSQLAQALSQGAGTLAEGYTKRLENEATRSAFNVLADPNSTPLQKLVAHAKLPKGIKEHTGQTVAAYIGEQAKSENQKRRFNDLISEESKMQLTSAPSTETTQPQLNAPLPVQSQVQSPSPVRREMTQPTSQFNLTDPTSWNEAQLVKFAGYSNEEGDLGQIGNRAIAEMKRRETEHKRFTEERQYHTEGLKETEKNITGLRESLPKKKVALALARDAIESGEVGEFSLNNLAERTGLPEFKTAKGAQLITASKENLLSNMARTSARAQNQWFEQRLSSMFPQVGQSKEANETIQLMLEGEYQMDENYLNAFNDLSNRDQEKYGYIRKDIDQRAREMTDKINDKILEKTSFKTREVYEREKGITWMLEHSQQKVAKGTPLTPQMAKILATKYDGDFKKAAEMAKKLGYKIPTREEAEEWQ